MCQDPNRPAADPAVGVMARRRARSAIVIWAFSAQVVARLAAQEGAAREMKLKAGDSVTAVVKATEVMIAKPRVT